MGKTINIILKTIAAIIGISLILFWIIASLVSINKISFSVVTFKTQNLVNYSDSEMKINNKLHYMGKFRAFDNNLGLIILKLGKYKKPFRREGTAIFRLKEENQKNWEYEKMYSLGLFDSQQGFTFGIPVVKTSAGKTYDFQLNVNGISDIDQLTILSPNNFVTGYKYDRGELFANKITLIHFLISKTIGSFNDSEFILKSLVYLIPFVMFIAFVALIRKISHFKKYAKVLLLAFLVTEFTFSNYTEINGLFMLIVSWIVVIFILKLKSQSSFILSLILIVGWLLIMPFGASNIQEKLNVLVYAGLFIGGIQLFIEEYTKR